MEASELKRIAGKIVGDKDRSAARMRVYGWPVLIALAQNYLNAEPPVFPEGFVERTAGALTVAPGGPTATDKAAVQAPPSPPVPGAPLTGGDTDEGVAKALADLSAKAKPLADKLSQAQFIALQAANRNEEMSGHHEAVIQALVRKELLDGDLRVTALGRLVDGLATERFAP